MYEIWNNKTINLNKNNKIKTVPTATATPTNAFWRTDFSMQLQSLFSKRHLSVYVFKQLEEVQQLQTILSYNPGSLYTAVKSLSAMAS